MARDEILGDQKFQHGHWRDPTSQHTSPSSPTNYDEKVEQIHSGHFMISNPHRHKKQRERDDGFNFEDAVKSPTTSYRFGEGPQEIFEIDGSFAKLFQCLSLAYNGAAIVSPKWKTFKGMKLSWKDKIRLNNAIWREWHSQFVLGRKPILCHFSFPITDSIHSTPQAIVLEGKYWKRTLGTVVKEYMKWRTFYRKKRALSFSSDGMQESVSYMQDPMLQEILGGGANRSPEPVPMVLDEEALLSEFTDTLFTSLDQKFLFPNPRELSHMSTNADMMQPGLVQLQPSIDELMDTFEPLQGWLYQAKNERDVMKSVAQSMTSAASTFVFTGNSNNSFRPLLQHAQLSGNGSSSSTLPETATAATVNTLPQPTMMDTMSLEASAHVIAPPNQSVLDIPQQAQFNTQQQLTNNQQQFVISQTDLQQQQQQMTTQDISTQLATTQQKLQEVQQQIVAQQQFGTPQLQQQQIILQQQQQQQQILQQQQQQQQSQQNPLQTFGITALGNEATLHTPATGDTTRILLHNTDLSNLQTQLQNNSPLSHPIQGISAQGISAQQVLNPLSSVQVRIGPENDVKVGTPIHQLVNNQSQQQSQITVQQQQQRTLQQHQAQPMRTINQNATGGTISAVNSQQQQVAQLQSILSSANGNQTQAIKLLQQVANQVTQNSQPQQQQNIAAVQQTDNSKAIIAQLFEQNIVPSGGNPSFLSMQTVPQQPIPVQITKVVQPETKTHTAQPVTRNQLVNSVAKVPSPTKATPGSNNNNPFGVKATRPRRQQKAKQPPKIAPAPAPPTCSTPVSTIASSSSSTALLTQLLTQGIRPMSSKPAVSSAIGGGAVLIQPAVKSELTLSPASTLPSVLSVTSNLPRGVPFIGVSQTQSGIFTAATSSTSTTTNVLPTSLLGSSAIFSTPPKSEEKPVDSLFTIGVVSSPAGTSSGGEVLETPMEQTQAIIVEAQVQVQTPLGKKETHISAEQKRRVNIKSGFDMLQTLVPALSQNPNAKISKAQMLQKAVEYAKKMQGERAHINEELDTLKQEVAALNMAISETQSQLPASGVPVTRQRFDRMKDIFDEYVRDRTTHNWKFWIFSIIIRPLFESYNASVSTANTEELFRTVLAWLDQHCSLLALRPTVLSSLTLLSRTTSILSDPGQVPQQAAEAVSKRNDDEQKR